MNTAEPVCRRLALILFSLLITSLGASASPAQELQTPLVPPSPAQFKDQTQAVMERAEASFKKAEAAYAKGDKEEARRLFDEAVEVIMLSGMNLRANPRLDAYYTELVERIAAFDVPQRVNRPVTPPAQHLATQPSVAVHHLATPQAATAQTAQDDLPKANIEKSVIDDLSRVNENELAAVSANGIRIYGKYDFDFTVAQPVIQYINYFVTGRGRSTMEVGLQRSGRYRQMVEKIFKEERVPRDLLWLAQAESVWKPNALSHAAAKGIWQFIPSTGTRFGLTQTAWVDERSNPEKSTRAAARYLRWLYDHFAGDWMLAMAAYNSGENRIANAIAKCGYADFWELYNRNLIPQETRNYVPIILAITIISKNQSRYGFSVRPDPPINYEIASVPDQTDIRVVADLIGVPYEVVQDMNPELRRGTTPPGQAYGLRLPKGYKSQFEVAYAQLPEDQRLRGRSVVATRNEIARSEAAERADAVESNSRAAYRPTYTSKLSSYKVKRGDTLASLAKRHGVSTQELAKLNRMSSRGELLRGQTIRIPASVQKSSGSYNSRYATKSSAKSKLSKKSTKASKGKAAKKSATRKPAAKKSAPRRRR